MTLYLQLVQATDEAGILGSWQMVIQDCRELLGVNGKLLLPREPPNGIGSRLFVEELHENVLKLGRLLLEDRLLGRHEVAALGSGRLGSDGGGVGKYVHGRLGGVDGCKEASKDRTEREREREREKAKQC